MQATLANTPLTDWHKRHGARMAPFAGWSMPIHYRSIVEEHQATRHGATLFDVSHMARFRFDGPGARDYLDSVLTRRLDRVAKGRVAYALVTRDDGGILDDVLAYHLQDAAGQPYWMLVVNAGNRDKIAAWIHERAVSPHPAQFNDLTHAWGMIALQGPHAETILAPLVDFPLADLGYYRAREATIAGRGGIVSRTGYTGEDGFELIVGAAATESLWQTLVDAGAQPAGLGCRDTLRLEAGMPLYGHELGEAIDPFQAGLDFAVDLDKPVLVGRDALRTRRDDPARRRRVGLSLEGRRAAREHFPVLDNQRVVGEITSGTFSPTFERPLAMAYVEPAAAQSARRLSVDIRGTPTPAQLVPLPFYRREARKERV